ncbi:MAG: acyl-CoA dehydratase activase [Planctomycetota bacterium]
MPLFLGIDIGSTTVKVVALDREGALLAHSYLRSKGRPQGTLLRALDDLRRYWDLSRVTGVGFTGSGGQAIAGLVGGQHVNELIAQTRAVGELYPEARTVIEIGGQDSKLLSLELDERSGRMVLVDFAMNTLCAAGTGSFLDQQAERLAISIEDEFSSIALQSRNPARIAGRCTVFAKSDMIHLQQKGTLLADILAGLCLALTRNFKSVVSKGKAFIPPILFQGGLAYNQAVVRAFETVLGLEPGQLIVPDHHALMPALGTALVALEEHGEGSLPRFRGFEALQDLMRSPAAARKSMPPLAAVDSPSLSRSKAIAASNGNAQPTPVYLGIDVGSISTNVVLIDEHARVLARRYLPTAGRPLQAVSAALRQIGRRMARRVHVRGVATSPATSSEPT